MNRLQFFNLRCIRAAVICLRRPISIQCDRSWVNLAELLSLRVRGWMREGGVRDHSPPIPGILPKDQVPLLYGGVKFETYLATLLLLQSTTSRIHIFRQDALNQCPSHSPKLPPETLQIQYNLLLISSILGWPVAQKSQPMSWPPFRQAFSTLSQHYSHQQE